jgi:transketolase
MKKNEITLYEFNDASININSYVYYENENLVVLLGDIGVFGFQNAMKNFPNRVYNIGILEQSTVGIGAGMALSGFVPIIHTIAPFIIERAFEQIKLDFCYHQLPGNIVTVGSAFDYSNLGCTHHCYGDFALLKTLPGTEICFPASSIEFDQLFKQTYQNNKLTFYRIAGTSHQFEFDAQDIVFGKGIHVKEGGDVTIIATGPHLRTALTSSELLSSDGVSAEIIYIHTIRPLDVGLIRSSVEKTRKVIVVEEHMRTGGLGDDILRATYDILGLKFHSVSIPDAFVTGYGTYEQLSESAGLTTNAVLQVVNDWFK